MSDQEKLMLLNKVKNYLRITWTEEDDDVSDMIDRGIDYFKIRGVDVNFNDHKVARQLLFDWCRYVRNYKADEYENNFLSDVLNLQMNLALEEGENDGS